MIRRGGARRALAALGSLALAAGGCVISRSIGEVRGRDGGDGGGDGTVTGALCTIGAPLLPGDAGTATCPGALAEDLFRYALCTCGDLDLPAGFRSDSFDERLGPYTPVAADKTGAGAIGVNGAVTVSDGAEVQGTLEVAGTDALILGPGQIIHGNLKINGALTVGHDAVIRRDAWVHGTVNAVDGAFIAGDLVQPPNVAAPASTLRIGGTRHTRTFKVPPPCDCGATARVDVAAMVTAASVSHDDAAVGLHPQALTNPPAGTVRLGCGLYYVEEVRGTVAVTLAVDGQAALFVGGDFVAWEGLKVVLAPGATLDVFVAGNLLLGTATALGDPSRAAALRFYVAGGTVDLAQAAALSANVYAPAATVTGSDAVDVFGSLQVRGLGAIDGLAVHFDRAVLGGATACTTPPPTTCLACGDCTGQDGCSAGTCGPCAADTDCCDPLVCAAGRCVALTF